MEFAIPLRQIHWWLLPTVAVLVGVAFALQRLERRRQARLGRFVEAKLAPPLIAGFDARLRRPLAWLTWLGFAFLALAFAQPHWGAAWQEVHERGRDILICLDTSESMNAVNPEPSRLESAKQKILHLMDVSPGDRFGLIAFSGAAALQCPLTLDHAYIKAVLNAIDTDTISVEGTNIAAALEAAGDTFRDDLESGGVGGKESRAILLISDGEQVSGDAVDQATKAGEMSRVFVIGVGDPDGAEVQLPSLMQQAYSGAKAANARHISKLDEETLKRVATEGSGAYVRARADEWDIDQIRDRLNAVSARSVGSDLRMRRVNRYQWPLFAAITCFAAEGLWIVLMPWRRRRAPGLEKSHA